MTAPPSWRSLWPRLTLLWLAGIDLRLTMLATPPVLPLLHRDLHLDEKLIGALSTLPVLLLGLAAIPGSLIIARIGARRALIAGLVVVAASSALRGLGPSTAMLFAMTFAMGVGVSVIQPAFPTLVREWFTSAIGAATAVYSNGLLAGEALSASLTIPIVLPLVGGSWPWSFVVWAAPVLITALLIAFATPHVPRDAALPPVRWMPDWRDGTTWQLGLLQGAVSTAYFGANAFIPDYLHATGRPQLVAGCLSALNVGQLPATLIVLLLASRLAARRGPVIAAGVVDLAALAAFLVLPPAGMIAAMAVIGFCSAFILVLTLALPPVLALPDDVHRLSAGMFAIGYTCSFGMGLISGAIWDATHVAATALVPVAVGALTIVAIGAMLRLRPHPALAVAAGESVIGGASGG